jgi:cytosine/adenosine deaminase-related metal-dependent hydrolase
VIRYRASWVVPISGSPIRDGCVTVDGGRVAVVGRPGAAPTSGERDLGDVALMPGLVNAHTHLELSYLRDAVPPSPTFVDWVRGVIAARRQPPAPAPAEILQSVNRAIDEAVACGTVLVGDISNTLVTFGPLARSSLAAVVFNEVIRFNGAEAAAVVERASRQLEALLPTDLVRTSLAAHAPYSVAPLVFREIRRAIDRDPLARCSVHLSESAEEVEFIRTGQGPWRAMLEELGSWDPSWVPPSVSPVQYLDDSGFLDERVLAVHGVQMSSSDLARLAARRTTLVTCPRSNRYTGAGAPPLEAFYASGVRIAVGTDSLASAPSLNVFDELAAMRELAPMVPASALLDSATRQGARALGFEAEFGSIEPGKRARLLAVSVPPGTEDVEEYLLGGIRPDEISWVD